MTTRSSYGHSGDTNPATRATPGAGLDVLPTEPPAADDPIVGRDDVVITPHTGFYSEEALLDLQTTVASDVAAVLAGETPKYPVAAK